MAHYSIGPVQLDTGKTDRRAWLGIGPATYGKATVGFPLAGPRRSLAVTWRPALDRIRRADHATSIRDAAQGQIVAFNSGDPEAIEKALRRMSYAQRCATS